MVILRALVPLLLFGGVLWSCSDVALALVNLDLEVTASSEQGAPISNAEVWLVHHGLPREADPSRRRHLVCTTDGTGWCAGRVRYSYDVHCPFWRKPEGPLTSPNDFELTVKQGGQLRSLGFLPPLTGHQVQGFETVRFSGSVPVPGGSADRPEPATER